MRDAEEERSRIASVVEVVSWRTEMSDAVAERTGSAPEAEVIS